MEVLEIAQLQGNLSQELVQSEFFTWYTSLPKETFQKRWLMDPKREPRRDRIFEAYLKSEACGPEARALIIATSTFGDTINDDIKIEPFFESLKRYLPNPLNFLLSKMNECNIVLKKGDSNEAQLEDAVKRYVEIKRNAKR